MGEEPDGQRMLPEDYGALYIQFATAIHRLVPDAKLGGPSFEGTLGDVEVWPDANGRVSFLGRFLDYLKAHGRLTDFTFFSFEHYPRIASWNDLYHEPLADAAHAADPAWLPPVAGQDHATPRSLHREPTLQSDLRNDDCVPVSTHPAGPSSRGPRASSEPGSAPQLRSRHPTEPAANTVRILSAPLHSRHATARMDI